MPASPVIPLQSMREAFGLGLLLLGWYPGIVQRNSLLAGFFLSQTPWHPDNIPKNALVWFGLSQVDPLLAPLSWSIPLQRNGYPSNGTLWSRVLR